MASEVAPQQLTLTRPVHSRGDEYVVHITPTTQWEIQGLIQPTGLYRLFIGAPGCEAIASIVKQISEEIARNSSQWFSITLSPQDVVARFGNLIFSPPGTSTPHTTALCNVSFADGLEVSEGEVMAKIVINGIFITKKFFSIEWRIVEAAPYFEKIDIDAMTPEPVLQLEEIPTPAPSPPREPAIITPSPEEIRRNRAVRIQKLLEQLQDECLEDDAAAAMLPNRPQSA